MIANTPEYTTLSPMSNEAISIQIANGNDVEELPWGVYAKLPENGFIYAQII